jgi:hypothetical protein
VSAVTDALDRMDFWSRELMFIMTSPDFPSRVWSYETRMQDAIAVSQFQAAQESARNAEL